ADGDASTVTVLMGNGNGTFAAGVPYEGGGDATPDVALGDVNHDGNVDIIAAARFNMIGVLLGNGDGTFGTASTYSTIFGINHLTVGDFNADGNLDVLTDGFTGSGGILMGD